MATICQQLRPYTVGLILTVFVPFFVLQLPSSVNAATYYVSPSGNNSNSCGDAKQETSPKKTINGGLSCLASGDTLEIGGGTYDEQLESPSIPNGTSGNYTTLRGRDGEQVWVRPTDDKKGLPIFVFTNGSKYMIVKNMGFDGKDFTKLSGQNKGIKIHNNHNISNIIFDQIEIKNFFGENEDALTLGTTSRNITVRNSYFHDIMDNTPKSGPNQCIYIRSIDTTLIENNIFERCNTGMTQSHKGDPVRNVIIRNNIYRDVFRGINILDTADDLLIMNNILSGLGQHGIRYYGGKNIRILNNTIYDVDEIGIRIEGTDKPLIQNNIIWKASTPIDDEGGAIFSNNLTSNPQFVDAGNNDFHLMPSSPAINAGLEVAEVVDDFENTLRTEGAYDIGAFEFTTSPGDNSAPAPPTGLQMTLN